VVHPSQESLELLLTKLARLRLKVASQKRESAGWSKLPAAEHRQAAWQLQADKERLAELELLVWLATQAKVETLQAGPDLTGRIAASWTTKPLLAPSLVPSPSKPDAET